MLERSQIKNLTVFQEADLRFSSSLNVVIGENGTGKSHLLKTIYSVIAASEEQGRRYGKEPLTKSVMQKAYADKLVHVLRPETLGRLARRRQGRERCELRFDFDDPALNCELSFSTNSKSEVNIEQLPAQWQEKAPVFLPTRELMTLYPGFVPLYESHYLEFEETYRDACLLLGRPTLKGPREKKAARLLAPLEEAIGGKVVLDKNGRFYLKIPGQGNMEMPLVAEGLRKLAMVLRLIATGSLLDKGVLLWDEPETNLNPRLIRLVAHAILELCCEGIQVFVATHSLFLLREFELLLKKDFSRLRARYFALRPVKAEDDKAGVDKVRVDVEQGDRVEDLETLVLLDEELQQSDCYIETEGQL